MIQIDDHPESKGRSIAWAALVLSIAFAPTLQIQTTIQPASTSILWPAHAILAGLMLRFPALRHYAFWAAVYAIPTLARFFLGMSWHLASLYSLAELSGILFIRCTLVSRHPPQARCRPKALGKILLASGTAAAITTVLALSLLPDSQLQGDIPLTAVEWFFRPFLGYCIFLPPLLLLPKYGSRSEDQLSFSSQWLALLKHPVLLLPCLTLVASTGLSFVLNGLAAIILPIPALLYCAWLYSQRTSAWLTAGTATLLLLSLAQGWISIEPPLSVAPASLWEAVSLHLGILLLMTAPLLLSSAAAARDAQISRLTQALDHDTLTNALSRAAFLYRSQVCLDNDSPDSTGIGMLMLDIDHFKHLNDHYGHAAGDQALEEFAHSIYAIIRPNDLFGRVGGEEFGITLPDTSLQASIDTAERLRACIEALIIRLPDSTGLSITVSIGVAHTSQSPDKNTDKLLGYADQALYQAKRSGRNQVFVFQDDPERAENPDMHTLDRPAALTSSAPISVISAPSETTMTTDADYMPLVALLEDDPAQSAWLQQILLPANFRCQAFDNGNDLLSALRAGTTFQLLLLDWELPGISGMEVLRWIRANLPGNPPVIFVTSRTLESDLVKGLDAGANDYICKPSRPAELLARIRAQLRPNYFHTAPASSFELGVFSIDTLARQIKVHGEPVQMTAKEFDLAALFLRHPWRLFSRDDLSALVWNREIPSTSRTLDTHMSNIRKKLQLGPASGTLLSSSYALGYRLELLNEEKTNS